MKEGFKPIHLPVMELAKITAEINTNYGKYKDKRFAIHMSYGVDDKAYWYYFVNHGFDEYTIYARIKA